MFSIAIVLCFLLGGAPTPKSMARPAFEFELVDGGTIVGHPAQSDLGVTSRGRSRNVPLGAVSQIERARSELIFHLQDGGVVQATPTSSYMPVQVDAKVVRLPFASVVAATSKSVAMGIRRSSDGGATALLDCLDCGDGPDIMSVVLSEKSSLAGCDAEQRRRQPERFGTVVLAWVFDGEGLARDISVRTPEFGDTYFAVCVADVIRQIKLAEPPGKEVPVVFPFKFGRKPR